MCLTNRPGINGGGLPKSKLKLFILLCFIFGCYVLLIQNSSFLNEFHWNYLLASNLKATIIHGHRVIEFNPRKTQAMLITKKRKTREIDIQMKGTKIEIVKHMKYLGVIIENKNKWNQHLDLIANKSRRLYHQILRTTGKEWGLSSDVLRTIYISAIEPILTYSCSSWNSILDLKTKRAKLLSIQRSFAISIIKGYKSISAEAALVLANIEPIDLKIRYCSSRYLLKKGIPDNEHLSQITFQLRAPFSYRPHPALTTNFSVTNCRRPHQINIFTDGSKLEEQTGCAFVALRNDLVIHIDKKRLANECSVFQAELLAILSATEWCIDKNFDARIHCDSQAAIKAVCSRNTSDALALDIQKSIQTAGIHICIIWVKAHVGNAGNEMADQLAKEATKGESIYYHLDPISYGLRFLKLIMTKDWNIAWKTAIKGRTTAAFFPSIEDRRNCHFLPNYVQTQFLTGHGRFAAYLERRKIHSSDRCICGERQTAEHVLLQCPATFNSRALVEARIGSLKSLEMNKKNFQYLLEYMTDAYKILPPH